MLPKKVKANAIVQILLWGPMVLLKVALNKVNKHYKEPALFDVLYKC